MARLGAGSRFAPFPVITARAPTRKLPLDDVNCAKRSLSRITRRQAGAADDRLSSPARSRAFSWAVESRVIATTPWRRVNWIWSIGCLQRALHDWPPRRRHNPPAFLQPARLLLRS